LLDRCDRGRIRIEPPLALELGEDRWAVAAERAPDLVRERAPGVVSGDLGDQRLCHGVDAEVGGNLAEPPGDGLDPRHGCGRELTWRVRLEQDERPDPVRMADRKVERHRSSVAAADHHRRRRRECLYQLRRVGGPAQRRSCAHMEPGARCARIRAGRR
jgi:hypothetical protein